MTNEKDMEEEHEGLEKEREKTWERKTDWVLEYKATSVKSCGLC